MVQVVSDGKKNRKFLLGTHQVSTGGKHISFGGAAPEAWTVLYQPYKIYKHCKAVRHLRSDLCISHFGIWVFVSVWEVEWTAAIRDNCQSVGLRKQGLLLPPALPTTHRPTNGATIPATHTNNHNQQPTTIPATHTIPNQQPQSDDSNHFAAWKLPLVESNGLSVRQ